MAVIDMDAIAKAVAVLGCVGPFSVRSTVGGGSIACAHPTNEPGEWWLGSPTVPPELNEAVVTILNAAPLLMHNAALSRDQAPSDAVLAAAERLVNEAELHIAEYGCSPGHYAMADDILLVARAALAARPAGA